MGTLRRELLDHAILYGEQHLEGLLKEYLEEYCHPARSHQSLHYEPPIPASHPATAPTRIVSIPVVGGLHHRYERAAA